MLSISNEISKIYIKFRYWLNTGEFRIPPPSPKICCFYEYCKKILNNELTSNIHQYEQELLELMRKHNITREEAAQVHIEVYSSLYKELN